MKKYLFFLGLLCACQSHRLPLAASLPPTVQAQPDAYAGLDSVPAGVNAAQMPLAQPAPLPAATGPQAVKSPPRRLSLRHTPADTGKIYTRRAPIDVRPVNRLARTSLWLGIGTWVAAILSGATDMGGFGLAAILAAVGALVTSIMGLSEIKRKPDGYRGKGQAIAGLVLGGTFILLLVLVVVILLVVLASFQ